MTKEQFRSIRIKLALTQQAWGEYLGYGTNGANRIISDMEAGRKSISPQIALLAQMYERHGVPDDIVAASG
jgi:hypothetical protein